ALTEKTHQFRALTRLTRHLREYFDKLEGVACSRGRPIPVSFLRQYARSHQTFCIVAQGNVYRSEGGIIWRCAPVEAPSTESPLIDEVDMLFDVGETDYESDDELMSLEKLSDN
ncbi:hypothetical protein As57867_015454, partial [Aphanomyces stellatus]